MDRFHPQMCLTASMTDAVLIDVATEVEPSVEVVFIDTGYHFPKRCDPGGGPPALRAQHAHHDCPAHPVPLWQSDPIYCCTPAKVAQLERALLGKRAWMSGLRRQDPTPVAKRP